MRISFFVKEWMTKYHTPQDPELDYCTQLSHNIYYSQTINLQ